jgi:hypothetical protein
MRLLRWKRWNVAFKDERGNLLQFSVILNLGNDEFLFRSSAVAKTQHICVKC